MYLEQYSHLTTFRAILTIKIIRELTYNNTMTNNMKIHSVNFQVTSIQRSFISTRHSMTEDYP